MDKRISLEINKLLKEAYDQIYFPKEDLYGYFFRYGIVLIFSLFLIELVFFLPKLLNLEEFLILSILFTTLNSFIGNVKSALILISSAFFIGLFNFFDQASDLNSVFTLFIFLLTSTFISIIINVAKRADLSREFGRREKNYLKQIDKLIFEKNRVIEEIKSHDEFISIASHELKTPLTSTLLKLQTALDNIKNVSLANFSIQNLLSMLESAEQQAQTLSKMINDLLSMSLIRNGRMQMDLEEIDLGKVTENIVASFSEKIQKEKIKFDANISENITGVFDKIKIEQVVINLLSNAIKYGDSKPIIITVSKNGDLARISVKDNGLGISKDIQNKIFNLYERGSYNQDQNGLGIGLFISNQIIKAHKGRLLVKSSPGRGSIFTVELPLKKKF